MTNDHAGKKSLYSVLLCIHDDDDDNDHAEMVSTIGIFHCVVSSKCAPTTIHLPHKNISNSPHLISKYSRKNYFFICNA